MKGYTNFTWNWRASMIQTVFIDWQWNADTVNPESWTVQLYGLDSGEYNGTPGSEPAVLYVNWGRDLYHDTSDTPRSALQDQTKYVWRRDKFWSYLMWEPLRSPGSIPVPIRLNVWTWRGATAKLATNTVPGTWTRTGYTDARAGLGDDYFIHPIWETNVVTDSWMGLRTTNAFWYATP